MGRKRRHSKKKLTNGYRSTLNTVNLNSKSCQLATYTEFSTIRLPWKKLLLYIIFLGFICWYFINDALALIEIPNILGKVSIIMIPQQTNIIIMFFGSIFILVEVLLILMLVHPISFDKLMVYLLISRQGKTMCISGLLVFFVCGVGINNSIKLKLKNYNYMQCSYTLKDPIKFPKKLYVRDPITCETLMKLSLKR